MTTEKLLLGKMLGQMYRLQRKCGVENGVSDAKIFGLLRGIEVVIDESVHSEPVTRDAYNAGVAVLQSYQALTEGFSAHDLANDLEREVGRGKLIGLLIYLKADGKFEQIIRVLEEGNVSGDYKNLEIDDTFEK